MFKLNRYKRIVRDNDDDSELLLDGDEIMYGTGAYHGLKDFFFDKFFSVKGFQKHNGFYVKFLHKDAQDFYHFEIFDTETLQLTGVGRKEEDLVNLATTDGRQAIREYFIENKLGDWYYPELGDIVDTEHGRGVVTEQDDNLIVAIGEKRIETTKDMKRVGNIYEI